MLSYPHRLSSHVPVFSAVAGTGDTVHDRMGAFSALVVPHVGEKRPENPSEKKVDKRVHWAKI